MIQPYEKLRHTEKKPQDFPKQISKMYNRIKNSWVLYKCATTESTSDLRKGQKLISWKLDSLSEFFEYYGIILYTRKEVKVK